MIREKRATRPTPTDPPKIADSIAANEERYQPRCWQLLKDVRPSMRRGAPEQAPASAVAAAVRDAGAEALEVEIETTPELMAHFSRASIPTVGFSFGRVRGGRLMLGVSFDWTEGESQAIAMVPRILRGESPAAIPVYQTRKYGIAVNLELAGRQAYGFRHRSCFRRRKYFGKRRV